MTANDSGSIVKDLFGIADCELMGTEETIDKGKRVKNIRLAYCPRLAGFVAERRTATADARSKSRTPPWEAYQPA